MSKVYYFLINFVETDKRLSFLAHEEEDPIPVAYYS